ncbi:MAG: ATP phosphoribosyltransferase regulatory subunit [Clostridia bacterium]|nr:ATP phosphoribosyltransferase regulatory subunit [Clostridia bacterium]
MTWKAPDLSPAERATLQLRGLYEQYGYRLYQVSQFEEYGLYLQFKRFLNGGRILSFTDLDGRLLALKPDVTLSIAKNARLDRGAEKVYYIENVYRESLAAGTMQEIAQMGLEYIGGIGAYAQAEVLDIAQQTLASIGPQLILEVSHMGFLTGLFEALGLEGEAARSVLKALSAKSAHGVEAAAKRAGIGRAGVSVLSEITALSGSCESALRAARQLCLNGRMTAALDELYETVRAVGDTSALRMDFTLQGDVEYYDGLLMAGYLDGIPRAVLSGGRYDGLMKKLGKSAGAVGFALYLDDLKRLPRAQRALDADVLILADEDVGATELLKAVRELIAQGLRVRVERERPEQFTCEKVLRFVEGRLEPC